MNTKVRNRLQDNGLAKGICAIFLVTILGWLTIRLASQLDLPPDDFVEYWAAGRLQLTGGNPYSPEQLFALQKSVGWTDDIPIMMWNPPWTLPFVMPFGLFDYPIGRGLWFLLNLALMLLCIDSLWHFYGGPKPYRWLARIVSFLFLPTLVVLYLGQIGILILAGIVGFLHFERGQKWWLVGIVTVLIAIKPHLLYLFWIALLLWAIDQRRWSVVISGSLFGLVATAIPMLPNPSVIAQYLHALNNDTPLRWHTPTIGMLLRLLFGEEKHWLQFLPAALGALWFLFYWQQHRRTWHWAKQMPLLLLMSACTRPFGWTLDLVVLLPAVIQVTVWLLGSRHRWLIGLATISYLAISVLAAAPILPTGDFWRLWMAPALLLTYLVLWKQIGRETLTLPRVPPFESQSQTTGNPTV